MRCDRSICGLATASASWIAIRYGQLHALIVDTELDYERPSL
jgi:hypothetical protein